MAATKSEPSTPINAYDFLTVGTIKKIEAAIKLAVGEHADQLQVVDMTDVGRSYLHVFTTSGILCGNCGATIANEDQLVCTECNVGYRITLLIGAS